MKGNSGQTRQETVERKTEIEIFSHLLLLLRFASITTGAPQVSTGALASFLPQKILFFPRRVESNPSKPPPGPPVRSNRGDRQRFGTAATSKCSAIANCLAMRPSLPLPPTRSAISTSKVTPQPNMPAGVTGTPRLVRSHAVRRDIVRDWNFDEVVTRMER
ncbi:hypothetical protein NL676_026463 [Syzygium grande]|nr:hypothetical protein NL676_026463 [Syzygium grande]